MDGQTSRPTLLFHAIQIIKSHNTNSKEVIIFDNFQKIFNNYKHQYSNSISISSSYSEYVNGLIDRFDPSTYK